LHYAFDGRQYRYNTLIALKSDLNVELALMNKLTGKFLKSYQIWHHRRLLITHLRKPGPELPFITAALGEDAKNYHTWAYRQWILAEFNEDDLWSGELEFIDRMLREDVRNNSAWHHRFFVVWASGVRKGEEDRDLVRRQEIERVFRNFLCYNLSDLFFF
jgi:protein farnesyltransferase/geranylgeranyltransferase type-1 subunit alpha